jgi:ABC-2 type transport system ATP-binding protein
VKVIEVKNLVKKYRKAEKNAVDSISFEVEEGQFFALLGPNGAGKTTTISVLTTTLSKTSGEVKIAGFDLEKQSSKVRQNVGIIFQNPSLDQNLTAEENIRFHAVLYGLYQFQPLYSLMPDSYRQRVEELADVLGIKAEMHKPIKTFSGGMKRKLEIIRSLMHRPKVLFLDEPTTGLDPISRRNLWEYLQQIRKSEKITVFLTTHYLDEAEGADKVCIINQGQIVVEGTPNEIKKRLIQDFIEIDSAEKTKLETELKKFKLDFEKNSHFKVNVPQSEIQKLLAKIKTPLNFVQTHNPTLEEAYIEIVEKGTEQNNQ